MTHGLERHFESLRHSRDKTRSNTTVNIPGQASKRRYALARLTQLQSATASTGTPETCDHESYSTDFPWENEDIDDFMKDAEYVSNDTDHIMQDGELDIDETQPTMSNRRVIPNPSAERLYSSWKSLILTFISPFLNYVSRTLGKPLPLFSPHISLCKQNNCERKATKILCLLFDRE